MHRWIYRISLLTIALSTAACGGTNDDARGSTGGGGAGAAHTGGTGATAKGGSSAGGSSASGSGGSSAGGTAGSGAVGNGGSPSGGAGGNGASGGSLGANCAPIGTSSALAQLALSLNSGDWTSFTMGGLEPSLVAASTPASSHIMFYAARGVWDCGHKKLLFVGTSHTGGAYIPGAGGLISWDDATNQWTRETYDWSSEDPGHAYFHLTLNPGNGDLYNRSFNSGTIYTRAYGATGQDSWKKAVVADEPQNANQVAGGLEWFQELNGGAGGLVFVDQLGASWSDAALSSWTSQAGTSESGAYHNWIAHAGGFVYWGGGGDSIAMFRLSPTGAVTSMPDTPLVGNINTNDDDTGRGIIVAHPNGADLLMFGCASGGSIFRFDGTSWTNIGAHQLGPEYWIAMPVPDYGVVVFLRTDLTASTVSAMVYKP